MVKFHPDDMTAFPGALADGHGADGVTRFVTQSIARVSARSTVSTRHSSSRCSSRNSSYRRSERFTEWELNDWEEEEEEEKEDEEEQRAAQMHTEVSANGEVPDALAGNSPRSSFVGAARSTVERQFGVAKADAEAAAATMSRMRRSMEIGEMLEGDESLPLSQAMCGTFSCRGIEEDQEKINQDCACVAYPLGSSTQTALFIVLDGHGKNGDVIAQKLLDQLVSWIGREQWQAAISPAEISSRLVQSFEKSHASLASFALDAASGAPAANESGACAVALMLCAGRILVAHAGDCRAVLGSEQEGVGLQCVELTIDHKLELEDEARRIQATGAWIRPMIATEDDYRPSRVYADRSDPRRGPGLSMSRSLGDLDADECGVIPTPEVGVRLVDRARDRFIVLASDGLWEFLSSEHVVEVVGGFLSRGEPAVNAARFLIAKAALAWRNEEGDYRDVSRAARLWAHAYRVDPQTDCAPVLPCALRLTVACHLLSINHAFTGYYRHCAHSQRPTAGAACMTRCKGNG